MLSMKFESMVLVNKNIYFMIFIIRYWLEIFDIQYNLSLKGDLIPKDENMLCLLNEQYLINYKINKKSKLTRIYFNHKRMT